MGGGEGEFSGIFCDLSFNAMHLVIIYDARFRRFSCLLSSFSRTLEYRINGGGGGENNRGLEMIRHNNNGGG